jgi:hypothetical protein
MNRITALTLMSISMLLLTACEKQGPMEEAGEAIDDAIDDAADAVEDEANGR